MDKALAIGIVVLCGVCAAGGVIHLVRLWRDYD